MQFNLRRLAAIFALTFILSGCQVITGQTLGENIAITTTVKAKLAAEKGSTLTRVGVDTNRGVVQLSGVVASPADRESAERVTRSVDNVVART